MDTTFNIAQNANTATTINHPQLLLIEDSESDADIFKRTALKTEELGCNVLLTIKTSINDACQLLENSNPDIVALDLNLPDSTDALDALKKIKSVYKNGPIIALTGYHDIDLEKKLLSHGLQDYITKDELCPTKLYRAISTAVERYNMEQKELSHTKMLEQYGQEAYLELLKEKETTEHNSKVKGMFLANMSHEIRTPLHVILSMANFLKDEKLSPKGEKYLNNIISSGDSLVRIVNDILDLSKIEAGEISLEKIPCSVNEIIKKIKTYVSVLLKDKPVKIIIDNDKKLPETIIADPTRLHQILLNLVNNAAKFTSTGSITIKTTCKKQTKNNSTILFEVADTGIGIPQDKQKEIFYEFTQAEISTTRKVGGTGLGLSISKSLVELLGGNIGVKSKVSEGSTFWFELSFDTSTKTNNNEKASSTSGSIEFDTNAQILVAEDDIMNQEIIKHLLKKIGCKNVVVTSNGKEALEQIKKAPFDLIFMDCHMPIMDGFDTTKCIRELQKDNKKQSKIVAVTAKALKEDKDECIEAGMDDYISKPYSEEKFVTKLNKWLNVKKK